ncbi:MAG: aldehyde dehydrogenase family protein, partial [Deltaproteobacteria bacterium]|nr:aldehyde dehydrogenase family protein [Deltaproteobacteria bacterium]
MLADHYPFYLANCPESPNADLEVRDKYSGSVATRVAMATPGDIDRAIEAAKNAAAPMAAMAAYERQAVLQHCVQRFTERHEELALGLCIEAGKPIKDSRGEVGRLIDTFRIAAEESVRIGGEVMPMDITARAAGYRGMWKRVPIGPCSFIAPFNFPLNLAAHKVAPALAAGCPFVLKPASLTPVGALIIGEVLAETDLPRGAFSILPCRRDGADLFTTDDRLKLLSFTGSQDVGWDLKARAGKKPVVLELGGNAAVIVDEDADLDDAVARVVFGAFYQSGQSCIGVQRIIVHEAVHAEFKRKLVTSTTALRMGDPRDEETFIGPMISENEAARLEGWIASAVDAGATVLCGGKRDGVMLEATLLEGVARDQDLFTKEAFGPVAILSTFTDFGAALAEVNDSDFGLQAGVFTRDLYKMNRAWDTLEVGGVVIGDVPSWRVDHMPYGGVKESGLGREGIR